MELVTRIEHRSWPSEVVVTRSWTFKVIARGGCCQSWLSKLIVGGGLQSMLLDRQVESFDVRIIGNIRRRERKREDRVTQTSIV